MSEQIAAAARGHDPIGVLRAQDADGFIRFDASKSFADGTDRLPEMIGA